MAEVGRVSHEIVTRKGEKGDDLGAEAGCGWGLCLAGFGDS
jgi:hypothetical protein